MSPSFVITLSWKQPTCLSQVNGVTKLGYVPIMEYYQALTRNKLFIYVLPEWGSRKLCLKFPILRGYMLYYAIDTTLLKWENYKKQIRNGEQVAMNWYRMTMRRYFCGDRKFLCLDCSMLVSCLWYLLSFCQLYHWGKLVKGP